MTLDEAARGLRGLRPPRGAEDRPDPLTDAWSHMTVTAPARRALRRRPRAFFAGPLKLLIGGERVRRRDGRTFETLDPATGEAIARSPTAGPRTSTARSRPRARRSRTARGPAPRPRERGRADQPPRRPDRGARRRAGRARVARQRQAGQARARSSTSPRRSRTSATSRAGRRRSRASVDPRPRARTCSVTRARSRSACAGRSSPGTSRC